MVISRFPKFGFELTCDVDYNAKGSNFNGSAKVEKIKVVLFKRQLCVFDILMFSLLLSS